MSSGENDTLQWRILQLVSAHRSPQWKRDAERFIAKHPWCRFCGGVTHLQVHHIVPVHVRPDLELNPRNWIVLCMHPDRECHLRQGHLGNWLDWNRDIRHVAIYRKPNPNAAP